jgi:hypothetical protein
MTTARGKKAFWITVAVALIPTIGMTVFAWRMVGGVRRDAVQTDARLRALAWSCLAYADAFGGFPLSEAEMRGFTPPDALATAGDGYPATRAAALGAPAASEGEARGSARESTGGPVAGSTPAPTLDECLESIEVEWPALRDVQPILRSKGKPTLQGTAPTVGQWLYAMTERIRKG